MKKLFFVTLLLASAMIIPKSTRAGVDVHIDIGLPPPIVFAAPPEVIVIPETNVYAVPDGDIDIFFYNGWWWRPWEGRWYRSRNYGSGWNHYRNVPSFYREIPPGWRNGYREHRWKGNQWESQRIPQQQVQRNWNNWKKNKHWEKQNAWGVQGLRSEPHYRQQDREMQSQHRDKQPQYREPAQTKFRQQPQETIPPQSQSQYRNGQQQDNHGHGRHER